MLVNLVQLKRWIFTAALWMIIGNAGAKNETVLSENFDDGSDSIAHERGNFKWHKTSSKVGRRGASVSLEVPAKQKGFLMIKPGLPTRSERGMEFISWVYLDRGDADTQIWLQVMRKGEWVTLQTWMEGSDFTKGEWSKLRGKYQTSESFPARSKFRLAIVSAGVGAHVYVNNFRFIKLGEQPVFLTEDFNSGEWLNVHDGDYEKVNLTARLQGEIGNPNGWKFYTNNRLNENIFVAAVSFTRETAAVVTDRVVALGLKNDALAAKPVKLRAGMDLKVSFDYRSAKPEDVILCGLFKTVPKYSAGDGGGIVTKGAISCHRISFPGLSFGSMTKSLGAVPADGVYHLVIYRRGAGLPTWFTNLKIEGEN